MLFQGDTLLYAPPKDGLRLVIINKNQENLIVIEVRSSLVEDITFYFQHHLKLIGL